MEVETQTASNSYGGGTTVNAGILIGEDGGAFGLQPFGTGPVTVNTGATVALSVEAATLFIGNNFVLHGFGFGGLGALRNLDGANVISGTVTLSADGASIGSDETGPANSLVLFNTVQGDGGLTKVGPGTVELANSAGSNTYAGGTFVNDGTLLLSGLNNTNATGTGDVTVGDNIGAKDSAILEVSSNEQIPNTAKVTVNSDGEMIISTGFTETIGPLVLNAGHVDADGVFTPGSITVNQTASLSVIDGGGKLEMGANTMKVTLNPGSDLHISVVVDGSAGINIDDNGTLEFFGAANTYTGLTTVDGATVLLNNAADVNAIPGDLLIKNGGSVILLEDDQISNMAHVTVDNSTFDLNGHQETIDTLTLQNGGHVVTNGGTLRTAHGIISMASAQPNLIDGNLDFGSGSQTISVQKGTTQHDLIVNGLITGAAGLVKTGDGNLTLNGNNIYSGITSVQGGTLSGSGTIAGQGVDVQSGSHLAPGDSPGVIHTTSVTLESGSSFDAELDGTAAGSFTELVSSGTVTIDSNVALNINLAYASHAGDSFTLIHASGGIVGTFSGATSITLNGLPFQITYTNNDVTLVQSNRPPTLGQIADQEVANGTGLQFTVTGSDPDTLQTLSYSLDAAPAGASINPSTGVFSWTPAPGQIGVYSVTVRVTDNGTPNMSATQTFKITVDDLAPAFTSTPNQVIGKLTTLTLGISASDPASPAEKLTYSLDKAPAGASIDANTGVFTWTPSASQTGDFTVIVRATGTGSLFSTESFNIHVNDVKAPPTLGSISDQSVGEGQKITIQANGSDPGGETLTYSIASSTLPGVTVNSSTGLVTINPATAHLGSYSVTVKVTNTDSLSTTQTFHVTLADDALHHFVQNLYVDFLGRTGSRAELDNWVNAIPGIGQQGVANAIIHSTESLARIVDGIYVHYLGRHGDQSGVSGWVGYIQGGGTEEQVTSFIVGSGEFAGYANQLIGGSNASLNFAKAAYKLILGRTNESSAEDAYWAGQISVQGQQGVALGFLQSLEYRANAVSGFYTNLLGRTASTAEAVAWANSSLDLLAIESLFAGSNEFLNNNA
jgi:autotransporter-associated beta strand protein